MYGFNTEKIEYYHDWRLLIVRSADVLIEGSLIKLLLQFGETFVRELYIFYKHTRVGHDSGFREWWGQIYHNITGLNLQWSHWGFLVVVDIPWLEPGNLVQCLPCFETYTPLGGGGEPGGSAY